MLQLVDNLGQAVRTQLVHSFLIHLIAISCEIYYTCSNVVHHWLGVSLYQNKSNKKCGVIIVYINGRWINTAST